MSLSKLYYISLTVTLEPDALLNAHLTNCTACYTVTNNTANLHSFIARVMVPDCHYMNTSNYNLCEPLSVGSRL